MQVWVNGLARLTAGMLGVAAVLAALMPVKFLGDPDWAQPVVILGLALVVGIVLWRGVSEMRHWPARRYHYLLWGLGGLIVVIQGAVAWAFVDAGRADAFFVRNQAVALAQGHRDWSAYFSLYPNNVNGTLIESGLIELAHQFMAAPWQLLNGARFLWLDTGVIAGLFLLRRSRHWQPGAALFLLGWLLSVPVAAYGLFAYTDAAVMPLPLDVLALWVWGRQLTGWQYWLVSGGLVSLLAVGVSIKANLIVVWLALGILVLVAFGTHHLSGRRTVGWIVGALVSLALVSGGLAGWAQRVGYHRSASQALPPTSWIAMSLNPQADGQYQSADVARIAAASTGTRKRQLAATMIRSRLGQLGVGGALIHLAKKFRLFWATGDFDSFKLTTQWIRAPQWYLRHQRTVQFWLVLGTQAGYLTILVGAILALIDPQLAPASRLFVCLVLGGLTCFHVVIWEVEPRYALPLLPLLLFLSSYGWCRVPARRWSVPTRRWGRLGVGVLGLICVLSLAKTTTTLTGGTAIVGRQGNGAYSQPTYQRVARGQTLSWTVLTSGPSNRVQLMPHTATGRVRLTIRVGPRVVRQLTGTPRALADSRYPTVTAQRLTLQLTNVGPRPVVYGTARTRYSLTTGRLLAHPRSNLRDYLLDTAPKRPLSPPVIGDGVMSAGVGLAWLALG